jgi:hypothetical protein
LIHRCPAIVYGGERVSTGSSRGHTDAPAAPVAAKMRNGYKAATEMNHTIGYVLFIVAVGGNLVLLSVGLVASLVISSYRGVRSIQMRALAAAQSQMSYHRVDPISTPASEWVFMLVATVVVLLGLPVALAAIFHFVVPLIGGGWGG